VEKCSGLSTRGAREDAKKSQDWECGTCLVRGRPQDQPPNTSDDIHQKSEPKSTGLKRPLRILQWNAEGLNPKISELRCFLDEYKIDVALIQETQLMKKSATPIIKGYAAVRGDRKGAEYPGGGLLTYIKENVVFKSNGHCQRDAIELLSVSVKTTSRKWLTINNLYIPNGTMDLSWIPVKDNTIFAGDFNGHSQIWDEFQPSDNRGEMIIDWVLDNDLACLNDGSHTRVNRGTGGLSTPDITFVTPGLNTKSKWTTIEETDMGSDHTYP